MKTTTLALTALATAALITVSAVAQDVKFLSKSPIAWMDKSDREILLANAESVLVAPDGTATDWMNPKTGSQGKLKVLSTAEVSGTTCRIVRIRIETKSRNDGGEYRLCDAGNDDWKFAAKDKG